MVSSLAGALWNAGVCRYPLFTDNPINEIAKLIPPQITRIASWVDYKTGIVHLRWVVNKEDPTERDGFYPAIKSMHDMEFDEMEFQDNTKDCLLALIAAMRLSC